MEAEDRQALRRERKRQKDKKVRRIVWIVLAVLLAAIVILKLCEVDFGSLSGGSGTSTVLTGNFPYALDGSDGVTVHKQGAKLAVLTGRLHNCTEPIRRQGGIHCCTRLCQSDYRRF